MQEDGHGVVEVRIGGVLEHPDGDGRVLEGRRIGVVHRHRRFVHIRDIDRDDGAYILAVGVGCLHRDRERGAGLMVQDRPLGHPDLSPCPSRS